MLYVWLWETDLYSAVPHVDTKVLLNGGGGSFGC
jgi:hypothetical protein